MAYSCVGLWILLSGSVIMFNKYILSFAGFPFPITLTLWCARGPGTGGDPAARPSANEARLRAR